MSHKVIYDIIHGNIEISGFESILLKNPIVNRLHQVLQNSTAYTVFPNLKASRFEHSLGSMNYAGKMYNYGIINSNISNSFLLNKKRFLAKLIKANYTNIYAQIRVKGHNIIPYQKCLEKELNISRDLENLETVLAGKQFKKYLKGFIGSDFCDRNLSNQNSTNILLYQSLRAFGMLHDIGHLPLSHLFEFSIESVYVALADTPEIDLNSEQKNCKEKLKKLLNFQEEYDNENSEQIHEQIGKNITKYIFQDAKIKIFNDELLDVKTKSINIFIVFLIELLWKEIILGKKGELNSVYSIVSGTIDADRLDYVRRDGTLSGIAKATGNFDRIIEMFCLTNTPPNLGLKDEFIFVPSIQSLSDVEELLHQRFRIYKFIVNHHAVVRSNYIFQKVIQNQMLSDLELEGGIMEDSNLEIGKLSQVIDIAVQISNSPELITNFEDTVTRFIQLTDFWLLSILNKQYIASWDVLETDLTLNQKLLKEIYEYRKNYKSLWKRNHEYHEFLFLLGKELIQKFDKISTNNKELNNIKLFKDLQENFASLKKIEDEYNRIELCIEEIKKEISNNQMGDDNTGIKIKILEDYQKQSLELKISFINVANLLVALSKLYIKEKDLNYVKKFEERFLKDGYNILIRLNHLKTGIDNFFLIDKTNQRNIHTFGRFSLKEKFLRNEVQNSIGVFVFFNISDNINSESIQKKLIEYYIDNLKKILTFKT